MESPGQIEVYIPIKLLDTNALVVSSPVSIYPMKLPIAILSYKTPIYTMPKLSIFTDTLTVHSWDPVKFRLELTNDDSLKIMTELQETLIMIISQHPEWSGVNKISLEEVRGRFQPLISKNIMTLYLHSNTAEKVNIYSLNSKKPVTHDSFHQGQKVRVAIRFQGLIFLKNAQGNLFYRLQHQVSSVYL